MVRKPWALLATEGLEVRATAQRRLDRKAEPVIEQAEQCVRFVVAKLAGVAVLIADERVEEAGGQGVVAHVALHGRALESGSIMLERK